MKHPLALQLYSLRREATMDAEGTVRRVPSLGFEGVELAGTYGWPAEKWKQLLAETRLQVVAAHVGLEPLENEWPVHAEFQRAVQNRRIIVPALPERLRTLTGYREAAKRLNELGRRAKAEGFELLYHNHAFEFEKLADGSCGIDILLRETDPQLVRLEVDTYWVERGGRDSRAFIEQHGARIGTIHAKELRKRDNGDVPAGQGDIDWQFIIPLARKNGWPVIVEYEGHNAVAAVAESARYLSTL